MDALRVHVVFDQAFAPGPAIFEALTDAFDNVGMQRDGLRFSVPVHQRSQPWGAPQDGLAVANPRRLALAAAERNLVLILHDAIMADRRADWIPFVADIERQRRPDRDLVVPMMMDDAPAAFESQTQSIRLGGLDLVADEGARTRLLIQLLNAVLVHRDAPNQRDASGGGQSIFVSHAKRDGVDIAMRIVALIAQVNDKLGPRCFFDADSLLPGDDYPQRFENSIQRSSLLAVVTAAYHTRPWCRWEILRAKQYGRPVVAADLTDGRIERTFPYLGNVPSIRVSTAADADTAPVLTDEAVERLTLALLAESLRVALWRDRAAPWLRPGDQLCVRPPELTDLALLAPSSTAGLRRVLYPDPPLSSEELDLLHAAFPDVEVRTLSQVIA